jgi:hypothetical protein
MHQADSSGALAELVLCSNAAFDMEHRVSAHAIFSVVYVSALPFVFPGPFYAVVQLFNAKPGTHTLSLSADEGIAMDDFTREVEVRTSGLCMIVVPVVNCRVQSAGEYFIRVLLDGGLLPGAAHLLVLESSEEEEGKEIS